METIARIVQLIIKQQKCVLNPYEETELAEWIKSGEEEEIFYKKMPDKNQLADDLLKMEFVDTEYHTRRIISGLSATQSKLWSFYRILAIGCAVIGLGIGISVVPEIICNRKQSKQLVQQEGSSEMNEAMLKLLIAIKTIPLNDIRVIIESKYIYFDPNTCVQ